MNAILPIQGFLESFYRSTDTERLHREVLRQFVGPNCWVMEPREWSDSAKGIVAKLVRYKVRRLVLVSFSHGQSLVMAIAKELRRVHQEHNIRIAIDLWLSCDSVGRAKWIPRWDCLQWLTPRSLTRHHEIEVPHNIIEVRGVRQNRNRPAGHDIVRAKGNIVTDIEPLTYLPYQHTRIDGSPEWFNLVLDSLTEWSKLNCETS